VSHLIEIENPNRALKKQQKVTALDASAAPKKTQLSRKERLVIGCNPSAHNGLY